MIIIFLVSINQFIRAWTISLLPLPITYKVNTLRIVSTDLIFILTIKNKTHGIAYNNCGVEYP